MPEYSGAVIESQVDWLTCSAHGKEAADRLLLCAKGLAKEEQQKGNKPRHFNLMGYGGTHCGAIEYGQRDEASTLVRAIGNVASAQLDVLLSLADRVTRIDLATTWRAEPPDPHLGRNAYSLAMMHFNAHPKSAIPSRIEDGAGGSTTYIGNRESDYFLRVYNKEAESIAKRDPEGAERYRSCWRFELEIKATAAQAMADRLVFEDQIPHYVQDYLHGYCTRHGVIPPFPLSER